MWALFWNFRGGVDGHSFSQLEIGVLISGGPALVREIGLALQPPQDIPIVLTEDPGAMPNWVAAAAIMQAARTGISEKVAELRKTDPPRWLGRSGQGAQRGSRVVKFLSEETD
jgi:hypothetical protein